MRRLPMVLMALLLAFAPPALAASGKDRGSGAPGRAKVTATANPAKAGRATTAAAPRATTATRRGEARTVAAAPARGRGTAVTASSTHSRGAVSSSARGRSASVGRSPSRGRSASASAAATRKHAATPAYGREARLTWTSYGGRAHTDRFLSSAAAATSKPACSKRSRRGGCAAGSASWHRDLPPAANVQAMACPAGTMATLATGHSDVVRCMPL